MGCCARETPACACSIDGDGANETHNTNALHWSDVRASSVLAPTGTTGTNSISTHTHTQIARHGGQQAADERNRLSV